jgi:hypothetical protein
MFDYLQRELSALWTSFAEAIDRWGRAFTRAAARRGVRHPRVGPVPTRLPSPRLRRPVPHRLVLPPRLRKRTPPSVLARERMLAALRAGGAPRPGNPAEAGAERAAGLLRNRMLDLQRGLLGLQHRLGGRARTGR